MMKNPKITKILAIVGVILVWFPLLLPFIFGGVRFVESGRLHIDFLIPAEIFFVPFSGSVALLWAAVRAKSRRKLIAWAFAAMLFFLIVSQVTAVITGLADGSVQMGGWQSTLVFSLFGGFLAALVVIAVAGILLLRDLYRPNSENP
jgi:hypothetical protein